MSEELARPDLYLVARLLENLERAGGGLRPTALQLVSRINYSQLERYLVFLTARGLVERRPDPSGSGDLVRITPKGHEALLALARAIRDALREEFSGRRGGEPPRRP